MPGTDSELVIATVVGARPQFVKAAVFSRAVQRIAKTGPAIREVLIHTGQHYDASMSDVFFQEMGIPEPDHHLGVSGGTHGEMTGRMLEAIESVLLETSPDRLVIYGDTNSTLSGALAAVKLGIPVAHVEAGLRSFNRAMPEELNRVVADQLSDILFAPTDMAVHNLRREGIVSDRIVRTGDVMYDAMRYYTGRAESESDVLSRLGLEPAGYVLATCHRAENTDDPARLAGIVEGLGRLAASRPVILPVHPRTRGALERHNLLAQAESSLTLIDPVGYLDMVQLEAGAGLIATDSGGVQKEAYFHRVACITMRDETEWVELTGIGVNELVGADADKIATRGAARFGEPIEHQGLYGDGRAAQQMLRELIGRSGLDAGALAEAATVEH
ncbi:MAG: UDP-N-acetylglucosamine 2-epimerase (non-hydrolyzing) [Planctomycetota bacterium]